MKKGDGEIDNTGFYVKNKILFCFCVLFGLLFFFGMAITPLLPTDIGNAIWSPLNIWHGELEGLSGGLLLLLTAILFIFFGSISTKWIKAGK